MPSNWYSNPGSISTIHNTSRFRLPSIYLPRHSLKCLRLHPERRDWAIFLCFILQWRLKVARVRDRDVIVNVVQCIDRWGIRGREFESCPCFVRTNVGGGKDVSNILKQPHAFNPSFPFSHPLFYNHLQHHLYNLLSTPSSLSHLLLAPLLLMSLILSSNSNCAQPYSLHTTLSLLTCRHDGLSMLHEKLLRLGLE